jgi:hypothetical protein
MDFPGRISRGSRGRCLRLHATVCLQSQRGPRIQMGELESEKGHRVKREPSAFIHRGSYVNGWILPHAVNCDIEGLAAASGAVEESKSSAGRVFGRESA